MVCRDLRLISITDVLISRYTRKHDRRERENVLYQQATPFGDKRQLDRGIPL